MHADPVVSQADDTSPVVTRARAPQLCKRLRSDLNLTVAGKQLGDLQIAAPGDDEGWVAPQADAALAPADVQHHLEQSRRERTRPGTAKAKKAAAQRQVGGGAGASGVHISAWLPVGSDAHCGLSDRMAQAPDGESMAAAANQQCIAAGTFWLAPGTAKALKAAWPTSVWRIASGVSNSLDICWQATGQLVLLMMPAPKQGRRERACQDVMLAEQR